MKIPSELLPNTLQVRHWDLFFLGSRAIICIPPQDRHRQGPPPTSASLLLHGDELIVRQDPLLSLSLKLPKELLDKLKGYQRISIIESRGSSGITNSYQAQWQEGARTSAA